MTTLVKKAMRGDAEAFLSLIDMHKDTLLRIAQAYLSQDADIADAMQDTILDAYENIATLKEARYFKTWLIRILLNNCSRIYRKNKNFISIEEFSDNIPDEKQKTDTALLQFRELLSYVSEENRLCFQLYYGEELTTGEIAKLLNINENTIRSRMHREKIKLKKKLEQNGYIDTVQKKGAL